jgi:hypothetical protein
MFSVVRLLDVAEGNRDRVLALVRDAAEHVGAHRWVVAPTDPRSRNGGDILLHLGFVEGSQWHCVAEYFDDILKDPAISRVNGASYAGNPTHTGRSGTVYRVLLLRVLPGTDPDTVRRFESELLAMPKYVSTMTAWRLSRADEPIGDRAWTHVFEQEFTDADGLMGPYLMHPIHWAVVDRWFDPETTDVIIRDRVCHSFCAITEPVLS